VGGTALLGKITFERVKMFEDIFESVEVIFHGKGKKSKTSKEWKDKHFIRYINLIISLYPKKKNNHGISSIFGIETDEIGTYNKTIMANVLNYRIEECAFTFLLERGHFADMEGCITVAESLGFCGDIIFAIDTTGTGAVYEKKNFVWKASSIDLEGRV
jgi:hypothetical protein